MPEVLVALGLIGLLIAISLLVIFGVREAARRIAWLSFLKPMGGARYALVESHGTLP